MTPITSRTSRGSDDAPRRRGARSAVVVAALALTLLVGACGTGAPVTEVARPTGGTTDAQRVMAVADAARARGDMATAAALFRRASELDPESAAPLLAFAEIARHVDRIPDAIAAYERAIALAPGNADALTGLGKALVASGQAADAIAAFESALALRPADADALNGLGVALDRLGDHEAAQQRYIDGLEIAPDDFPLSNNLAFSLAITGAYADAIRILSGLAAAPSTNARIRQNLALVHGLAGNVDEAAEIARSDLGEDAVRNNLAYYARLRAMSKTERAAEILSAFGSLAVDR